MRANRKPPEEPPCETCKIKSMKENMDAIRVFFVVRDQLIMSAMGSPVAIMQSAIHDAMRLYRIKNRVDCFEKVRTLGKWWIERLREKK